MLSNVVPSQSGMAAGVGSTKHYLGAVAGIVVLGRVLDLDGSAAQVLAEHARCWRSSRALLASLARAAVLPRKQALTPARE